MSPGFLQDQQGQPPVSQRQILHEQHDEEQVLYSQAAAAVGPNVDNSGELTGVDQHRREKARKSQARHRERKKERLEALKSSNEELAIRSKSVQGELDALKIQKRTLEIELSRKSSMLDSADCEPEAWSLAPISNPFLDSAKPSLPNKLFCLSTRRFLQIVPWFRGCVMSRRLYLSIYLYTNIALEIHCQYIKCSSIGCRTAHHYAAAIR